MFQRLVDINCHSRNGFARKVAKNLLEKLYGCEINCGDLDKSVLFAHHARGCTIVASKICENVVIFQNVTIGTNMKYDKIRRQWQNVGAPIIAKNVIIADGAKVLGPIIIGENTVIGAGAIVTKSIPADSVAYGVNRFRPKDENFDLIFNAESLAPEKIVEANNRLIAEFNRSKDGIPLAGESRKFRN